jgi:hypothetical protein
VKGGTEAAVHATNCVLNKWSEESDVCVFKGDFTNAFNMMSRQHILSEVSEKVPGIMRWSLYSLNTNAHLFLPNQISLESNRGVQQGDPLGPLLFAVGLHSIPLKIKTTLSDLFQVWYLDDSTLIGKCSSVSQAIRIIEDEATKIGMKLNMEKSEVWFPCGVPEDARLILPPDVRIVDDDGIELLGAAVGSTSFTQKLLRKKLTDVKELHQKILELDDAQTELLLIRACASTCKILHFLRCCDFRKTVVVAQEFEDLMHETLEEVCKTPVSESSFIQASLPVRLGGLGLTPASQIAPAAFLGSATDAFPLVQDMISDVFRSLTPEDIPGYSAAKALFPAASSLSQDLLTSTTYEKIFRRLLENSSAPEKARLLSVSSSHAGCWLQALPNENLGLKFSNKEFVALLRLTLGLPVYASSRRCPVCQTAPLDIYGHHSLSCGSGGDRQIRHNEIRDALFQLCQSSGLTPRKEEALDDSSRRPGDIYLPSFSLGKAAAVDVSVVYPLQVSLLSYAAETPLAAAAHRESQKKEKYIQDCMAQGIQFYPVALETFGAIGPDSLVFLRKLANIWGAARSYKKSQATVFLFQRLAVALQRGNARMVLARG